MALVSLQIDPNEVKAIRQALEALVTLYKAKLLADGYFKQPAERKQTTAEDVRQVGSESVWTQLQKHEQTERRKQELLTDFVSPFPSGSLSDLP